MGYSWESVGAEGVMGEEYGVGSDEVAGSLSLRCRVSSLDRPVACWCAEGEHRGPGSADSVEVRSRYSVALLVPDYPQRSGAQKWVKMSLATVVGAWRSRWIVGMDRKSYSSWGGRWHGETRSKY